MSHEASSPVSAGTGACHAVGLRCSAEQSESCPAFLAGQSSACIVDDTGLIVRTNAAWDGFAQANGPRSAPCLGGGTSYLTVCDHAAAGGDADARDVAERLRALLRGFLPSFSLEYPCVMPTETRWFVLRASAFRHSGRCWAVVTHDDITNQVCTGAALRRSNHELDGLARQRAEDLRLADERARMIASVTSDGIWEWLPQDDRLFVSERMTTILGGGKPETGAALWERLHRADADRVAAVIGRTLKAGGAFETECRFRRPEGRVVWSLLRGHALDTQQSPGVLRVLGTLTDITARREAEELVKAGAARDPLTRLHTRTVFMDRVAQALRQREGQELAIVLIDLDGISEVNQRFGHQTGNDTIREAAWLIVQGAGAASSVSRIGGDEFAVLCIGPAADLGEQRALAIADGLAGASMPGTGGRPLSASIGVVTALAEHGEADAEELVAQADLAMLAAKRDGGNAVRLFEPEMRRLSLQGFQLGSGMREALANAGGGDPPGFSLVYQPIVDVATGARVGFEALMRWEHPYLGPISPVEFIPVAEQTGMIVPLGDWAMRHACCQLATWKRALSGEQTPFIGVNVSAHQLYQPDFEAKVLACIGESGIAPENLKVEVTESSILNNAFVAAKVLGSLRNHGVRLSIDDFGTGFSSLSYLSRFPFDELKIDRSFVREMRDNRRALEVVRTIIGLGRGLGMTVLAEGVEEEPECALLEELGCHHVQGYHFGRPTRADQIDWGPTAVG